MSCFCTGAACSLFASYLLQALATRSHFFYLELDRGTETLDRIVQKVEGYK